MTTQTEITVAGFLAFILEQPADRTIDHSRTWSECAVGDYVEDCGGDRINASVPFAHVMEKSGSLIAQIVYKLLNRKGNIEEYYDWYPRDAGHYTIDTYGELSNFIRIAEETWRTL